MKTYCAHIRAIIQEGGGWDGRLTHELLDLALRLDNTNYALVRALRQVATIAKGESDIREHDPYNATVPSVTNVMEGSSNSLREIARLTGEVEAYRDAFDRILRVAGIRDGFYQRVHEEKLHDVALERAIIEDLVAAKTEPSP